MHAEIIAIGTELTTGAKLDTNSQWLSLELADAGIPVRTHTTVADDLPLIVDVLRTAVQRADVVLLTGGLGPTLDDLTRDALSELSGQPLQLDEDLLAHIRSLFARRQRAMPERNAVQAMFPAGSEPIANPRGTAPGIWMEWPRGDGRSPCQIAALPGVPSEMKPMFLEYVLLRLEGEGQVIRRARINCFGVGESAAEELLGDLTARGRDPEVGITAHEATITLRITAEGRSEEECLEKIAATRKIIINRMGTLVFGEEDEELEHAVVRLLTSQRKSLATAESGTGGLIAQRLTAVPGFQACYLGGAVVPSAAAKRDLLDVEPALLAGANAVSADVADAMAQGARERFGSDFTLAVTEWPAFNSHGNGDEPPRSYVALAGQDVLVVEPVVHVGDPQIARSRTAKAALNLLRLHLIR